MANIESIIEDLHRQQEIAYQNGDTDTLDLVGYMLDKAITPYYLDDKVQPSSQMLPGVHWGSRDQRPYGSSDDSHPNTGIAL